MHYVAIVNGREREVEINEIAADRYLVVLEGRRIEVEAGIASNQSLSILIDGQSHVVELGTNAANIQGMPILVEVLDLRRMRLRKATESIGAHEGPAAIVAPMPGKVVAILIKEGDTVEAGQGILVVEAMKMENELKAPRAGVVKELTAQEGVAVDAGKVLCVIE